MQFSRCRVLFAESAENGASLLLTTCSQTGIPLAQACYAQAIAAEFLGTVIFVFFSTGELDTSGYGVVFLVRTCLDPVTWANHLLMQPLLHLAVTRQTSQHSLAAAAILH